RNELIRVLQRQFGAYRSLAVKKSAWQDKMTKSTICLNRILLQRCDDRPARRVSAVCATDCADEIMELSIVIPTYNRSKLLRRTLQGVCEQAGADRIREVLVVSDGSTD